MKTDYMRQIDFYNPERDSKKILIVGAGHIGSYVAFGLARMGVKNITICDHDFVEAINLPNQFFAEDIIPEVTLDENGVEDASSPKMLKVVALQTTLSKIMPDVQLNIIPMKYEEMMESEATRKIFDVVIPCADNMVVRKRIFDDYRLTNQSLIIDARTGGEFANILTAYMGYNEHKDFYAENLWDEGGIPDIPCTGKAVIDVSMGVAAAVVQKYRVWHNESKIHALHTFHDFKIGVSSIMMEYTHDNINNS